jgi:hypothetical protein
MARQRAIQPGDRFKMGIVCEISDKSPDKGSVKLGRPAEDGEALPPEHKEYSFKGQRVFMSDHSAWHRPEQVK